MKAVSNLPSDSLYASLGGREACLKLSTAFYACVARDPLLRPLFPGKSFTCAIEEFSAFLAQLLGGPGEDSQRRWWLSLRESHARFPLTVAHRSAWLACMTRTLDEADLAEPLRAHLLDFFAHSSAYVLGKADAAGIAGSPLANTWQAQLSIDEAVAAIRAGNTNLAIQLTQACNNRSILSGVLAQMIRCGQAPLLDYVKERLRTDPTLHAERFNGRTLLHEAASAGSLDVVQLLLAQHADPRVQTAGGHTPLYSVSNECVAEQGARVVKILVDAGADVDAADGVKKCTPLHMAARRGNAAIAAALLDLGANIEARDSAGDTPLRRAVNCSQPAVAALLIQRGANRNSVGSKGQTPIEAARTLVMKKVLESQHR